MDELPGLLGLILADEAIQLEGWKLEVAAGDVD